MNSVKLFCIILSFMWYCCGADDHHTLGFSISQNDVLKSKNAENENIKPEFDRAETKSFASRLSNALTWLARDELGTLTMQAAFDRLDYESKPNTSYDSALDSLVDQLSLRLRHYGHLVSNQQKLVSQLYREHQKSPIAPRIDCCNLSERDLRFETIYGARVSRRKCCDLIPFNLAHSAFNPGHNLTQRFRRQLDYWPNVKWLYFITADGLHTEFPAHDFRASLASMLMESLGGVARTVAAAASPLDTASATSSSMSDLFWARNQRRIRRKRHNENFHNLFNNGIGVYDCRSIHQLRHRDVFVRSVVPEPIWLVLVLDQSDASKTQLLLGQRIARLLLASLSEKDRVGLVLASDTVNLPIPPGMLSPAPSAFPEHNVNESVENDVSRRIDLFPAVHETKLLLNEYINSARSSRSGKTNHTRALIEAFNIIRNAIDANSLSNSLGPPTDNILIAYISRGNLEDLQEQNTTLRQVTLQQALLNNRVIINAYMPVEEKSSTVLFERTFMNDLATRWNVHSDPTFSLLSDVRPGQFFAINRTADLANTVGSFYELFTSKSVPSSTSSYRMAAGDSAFHEEHGGEGEEVTVEIDEDENRPPSLSPSFFDDEKRQMQSGMSGPHSSPLFFSLPHQDLEGKGLVMSISQAFYDNGKLLGVMGVDVHVADLLDQVAHFGRGGGGQGSTSAFIVHSSFGLTVSHPGLNDLLTASPIATSASISSAGLPFSGDDSSTKQGYDAAWTFAESILGGAAISSLGDPILHLDIAQYERVPGFEAIVRPRILSEANGTAELSLAIDPSQLDFFETTGVWVETAVNYVNVSIASHLKRTNVVYRWRRVNDPQTSFVVVLRSVESPSTLSQRQLQEIIPNFESCYHRLDLFKRDQACMYLRQLATFSYSTVYLPPRTFMRPFEQLTSVNGESAEQVRHMVAYLIDQTGLISNPGLVASTIPSTRTAVAVVERISKFWKQRGTTSMYHKHIIRRYVATDSGVMLMYPGALMPQSYDPTSRAWYLRALQFTGRLVVTGPYLDDGGAGSIITLSQAIFEGNRSGVHIIERDRVQAVVAMDIPHSLVNLLLTKWLPECGPQLKGRHKKKEATEEPSSFPLPLSAFVLNNASHVNLLDLLRVHGMLVSGDDEKKKTKKEETKKNSEVEEEKEEDEKEEEVANTQCMLLDDRGYLSAHPGLADARIGGPLESCHINHREPLIAADLLNHEHFVKKFACLSYTRRSLQRYYVFNTSYTDVVSNFAYAEPCTRYQLVLVPGTNVFFGQIRNVNQKECSPRAAFCSCSTKNRRCLNCGRMEQMECECPCECPVGVGLGLNRFFHLSNTTFTKNPPTSTIPSRTLLRQQGIDSFPVCSRLSVQQTALLPVPAATAAASWKAITGMPDAPPLCRHSSSGFHFRAPVASLHDWLILLLANSSRSGLVERLAGESIGGALVPAWGPVDCNASQRSECSASIGCEWCTLDPDGAALEINFCAPMGVCFGAVVGAASPYINAVANLPPPWNSPGLFSGLPPRWPPLPLPPGTERHSQHLSDFPNTLTQNNYYHYYYHHHYGDFYNIPPFSAYKLHTGTGDFLQQPLSNFLGGGTSGWPNSPVGPVTGAVMAVFIVVILGVYCLRHQASAARQRRNAAAAQLLTVCGTGGNNDGSTLLSDQNSDNGGPDKSGGGTRRSGTSYDTSEALGCEKPDDFLNDGGPDRGGPTCGAVALLAKSHDFPDVDTDSEETRGKGVDPHQRIPMVATSSTKLYSRPLMQQQSKTTHSSSSRLAAAFGGAAIVIEGVGVFVKSNIDAGFCPLSEFESDPTAISPYRVAPGGSCTTASPPLVLAVPLDASSTDNGYASTVDGSGSSCADRGFTSLNPDTTEEDLNVLQKPDIPPNPYHCPMTGPLITSPSSSSNSVGRLQSPKQQPTSRSVISDPDSALGSDFTDTSVGDKSLQKPWEQTTLRGPWLGTLILGPGMDDVMCAEEMEYPQQSTHYSTQLQTYRHSKTDRKPLRGNTNCSKLSNHRLLSRGVSGVAKSGLTRLPIIVQRSARPSDSTTTPTTVTTTTMSLPCPSSPSIAGPASSSDSLWANSHADNIV